MAMPQRDDTIEAIKRLDALLEYAVYHKSYRIAEPITVVVTPEAMTISSLPGPERSITDADLAACRMIGLHYRMIELALIMVANGSFSSNGEKRGMKACGRVKWTNASRIRQFPSA